MLFCINILKETPTFVVWLQCIGHNCKKNKTKQICAQLIKLSYKSLSARIEVTAVTLDGPMFLGFCIWWRMWGVGMLLRCCLPWKLLALVQLWRPVVGSSSGKAVLLCIETGLGCSIPSSGLHSCSIPSPGLYCCSIPSTVGSLWLNSNLSTRKCGRICNPNGTSSLSPVIWLAVITSAVSTCPTTLSIWGSPMLDGFFEIMRFIDSNRSEGLWRFR